jgi:dynein heavy chain, axonemal
VAMKIPSIRVLAEIVLVSNGFSDAKILANKIMQVFTQCARKLSVQFHYDHGWVIFKIDFFAIKYTVINLIGLRAIKSVLDCAIKQRFSANGESEETIIYKAIQSVSSAKYMSQDLLIYNVCLQII